MQDDTLLSLEKLFLALSDKTRLSLLGLMSQGEVPVGFLVDKLGESQPKVSRHLAYLRSMGVVSTRRDGKWIYYGIADQTDTARGKVLSVAIEALGSDVISRPKLVKPARKRHVDPVEEPEYEAVQNFTDVAAAPEEMEVFLL